MHEVGQRVTEIAALDMWLENSINACEDCAICSRVPRPIRSLFSKGLFKEKKKEGSSKRGRLVSFFGDL